MRKLKYLLWLALVFFPQWVFAANGATGSSPIDQLKGLAPGPYDQSVSYLGDLFGTVPGVLHGASGELLSTVFGVFNYGVLIAASIFIGYAVFRSVVDTANEGNFMGQGKNATYISLRVASGIGLLTPMFQGYSAIQVIVMFIVLHGAGFADRAWSKALDYLYKGGVVFVDPSQSAGSSTKDGGDELANMVSIIQMSSQVYASQVCMYRSEAWYNQKKTQLQTLVQQNPNNPLYSQQLSTMNVPADYWTPNFNDKSKTLEFPGGSIDSLSKTGCGSIGWDISVTPEAAEYAKMALQQMVLAMEEAAEEVAALPPPPANNGQAVSGSTAPTAKEKQTASSTALVSAAADFVNITLPARNDSSNNKKILDSFYKQSKAQGWVTAGTYYYNLALLQAKLIGANDLNLSNKYTKPNQDAFNSSDYDQITNLITEIDGYSSDAQAQAATQYEMDENNSADTGWAKSGQYSNFSTSLAGAKKMFEEFGIAMSGMSPTGIYSSNWKSVSSGHSLDVIQVMFGPLFYVPVKGWLEMVTGYTTDGKQLNGDPIMLLQGLGYQLMTYLPKTLTSEMGNAIVWIFIPWNIGGHHGGIIGAIISALTVITMPLLEPTIKIIMLLALLPFFLILSALFFVVGAILGIYLPLIPFIIFTVGVVGWLIAVIEAMVAAPLVALGVTHPEGHDLLGKSEQAVMLLLSVFIRPITMVIGLLAGMVLSYVVIFILNNGFGQIATMMVANKNNFGDSWGVVKFAMPITLMAIYTYLAMSLVQKSYSLIYIIPEKTMRWLGLAPDHDSDATQIIQQGQGMVSSGAGRGFEGAKSVGTTVGKAGLEAAKQGAKVAMM